MRDAQWLGGGVGCGVGVVDDDDEWGVSQNRAGQYGLVTAGLSARRDPAGVRGGMSGSSNHWTPAAPKPGK